MLYSVQMLWLKVPNYFVDSYIFLFLFTTFLSFCKSYFSVSAKYISQCWSVEGSGDEAEVPNCFVAAPPAHFRSSTNYLNYPSTSLKNSFLCKYNCLNYPSTSTELPKYYLLPTLRNMSSRWTLGHNYTITPTSVYAWKSINQGWRLPMTADNFSY